MNKSTTSQNYRTIDKSQSEIKTSQPKLPNVSDIMNIKLKQQNEKDLQELIQNLVKQVQQLNNQVIQKEKQIQQYEFMIKSLQIAIEKRDCIISALRQEKQLNFDISQSQKLLPRSDDSSRTISQPKRSMRARTKETNFEDSLQSILDNNYIFLQQYMKLYDDLGHLQTIKQLVQNEETFLQNIQKMELSSIVNIFDALLLVLHEHKILFKNVIKIDKLYISSLKLYEQIPLNDQLDEISIMIKDALDCDKVIIYVFDNERQELWAKIKDRTIKLQLNEDIVGCCFQDRQIINVHNAYNDPRFKREGDKSYKTNTILLGPVLDHQQNSIGVVYAVNKMNGHFTNDDQQYISKVCEVIAILLRNHQQSSESVSIQNSLRNVIQSLMAISYLKSTEEVLYEAEKHLKNLFHTQQGLVYLVHENRLLRSNQKRQFEIYQLQIGIVGETHKLKEFQNIGNAYNHQSFNNLVDIETTMPIYCHEVEGNKRTVILQVINTKGIRSQKVNSFDQELLEMFGKLLLSKLDFLDIDNYIYQ